MSTAKPLRIVIAGGGTAGWMAAALLSYHLPKGRVDITLIESEDIGTIGVGESTIPPFIQLIRNLGIPEADFIRNTNASFKLGIRFEGWRTKDDGYFHPFGQIGAPIDQNDFYQSWLKAKSEGHPSALQDFAPASVMARKGRFMLPQLMPNSPAGAASYALHVDAKLVANYLCQHAKNHGVMRIEGMIEAVQLSDDGNISTLKLKGGQDIEGDFFIDCTGFRALLIGKALNVGYTSWEDELFCNRAIAVQTQNDEEVPPYTLAEAQDYGWRWRIPLQTRAGNGYVFSSQFLSDDEAIATLLSKVSGKVLTDPLVVPFTSGMREKIWHKNCLSLGLASGFIEPLESTAIHLVYRTLDFFLRFWDARLRPAQSAAIAEFNRRIANDYIEIKDFIVLHYALTQRNDTAFWRLCHNQKVSDTLANKIEVFRATASLTETGVDELFRAPSWQSVLEGMGVSPTGYSALIDRLETTKLKTLLDDVGPALSRFVDTLPTMSEFIKDNCPVLSR